MGQRATRDATKAEAKLLGDKSDLIPPTPAAEEYARAAAASADDASLFATTDPFALFAEWLAEARKSEPNDPNAMALATADAQGAPDVRMVLLKDPASDEEADAYFATRAKDSQIGAWASEQSRPMEGRFALEKRIAMFAARYGLGTTPRPLQWQGWRIVPTRIEFWRDRPFRLHDRLEFTRGGPGQAWTTQRLYP